MKKTYIIPEAVIVTLSMCNIIAGSPIHNQQGDGGQLTKEYAGDDNSAGSKNVWDEEW